MSERYARLDTAMTATFNTHLYVVAISVISSRSLFVFNALLVFVYAQWTTMKVWLFTKGCS